jgi:regulator of protease activity HflC (stomatin/prohibitin superfamily)
VRATEGLILVVALLGIALRLIRLRSWVPHDHVGVVMRAGQVDSVRKPGAFFLPPTNVLVVVDMRELAATVSLPAVPSAGGSRLCVVATIAGQVVEPELTALNVPGAPKDAMRQLLQVASRELLARVTPAEALAGRDTLPARLEAEIKPVARGWGIRLDRIEVTELAEVRFLGEQRAAA